MVNGVDFTLLNRSYDGMRGFSGGTSRELTEPQICTYDISLACDDLALNGGGNVTVSASRQQ